MFFGENPFYLLGSGARETEAAVKEALERRAAEEPSREVEFTRAVWILRREGTRTEAEFYWPVDVPVEECRELVRAVVAGKVFPPSRFGGMAPLSRVLFLMNELYYGKETGEEMFFALEEASEALTLPVISRNIREAREASGFRPFPDDAMLEGWMQGLIGEIGRAAGAAAVRMGTVVYADILYRLGLRGKRGIVYWQLLSDYEDARRKELLRKQGEAAYAARLAESHPEEGLALLTGLLPELVQEMRPLYGRDGCWALAPLFHCLRNRMIAIYETGGLEMARPWLTLLMEHFDMPFFAEKLADDWHRMEAGRPLIKEKTDRIPPRQPRRILSIPTPARKEAHGLVTRILAAIGIVAALFACAAMLR